MNKNKTLLTQQEETELCDRWQKKQDKAARDKMVVANMGLVGTMVRQIIWNSSTLYSIDDLTNECVFGLLKAIDKFDGRKGNRFSTYASWWVRVYLQSYITLNSSPLQLPASSQMVALKFRQHKMMKDFTDSQGNVDLVKAGKKAGIAPDSIRAFNNSQARVSLGECGGSDESRHIDVVDTEMLADEVIEKKEEHKVVQSVLSVLDKREKEIISGLFFKDKTQADIGREQGCSRQRIEQLKKGAMKKMREQLMAA